MKNNAFHRLCPLLWVALKHGFDAWFFLARLSVPAMIITRLLIYFDLIQYVALAFRPFMSLLGLPPEAALIWVTSMLANLYAGVTVFFSLLPVMPTLTLAQMTVISCLCLLAHSLLIEGQICKAAGLSFVRVSIFRIVMAFLLGLIIHAIAAVSGWGADPAVVLDAVNFATSEAVPSWGDWLKSSVEQLAMILVVVEFLMIFMEIIKHSGLTRLISKMLGPPLRLAGVGENAVMVTVIGCVLGLGYGGGLIVAESRSGYIANRDIFAAVTLMAIFHSMLEDSLVMWALGGSMWWILPGRLIFALAIAAVVNRLALRKRWKPILVGNQLDFETV